MDRCHVDRRKVGRPLEEAVFAEPNCALVFHRDLPGYGVTVDMAPVLDGVAGHMADYPDDRAIRPAEAEPVDLAETLLASGAEHIGPADYVPWQRDNKVCFLRMEWRGFGEVGMHLEARLSVEDSPNSAGVVIDAVRCARVAVDRGLGGPIEEVSAFTMKRPPRQMRDSEAREALDRFIGDSSVRRSDAAGSR